jgi:hypothetical protein
MSRIVNCEDAPLCLKEVLAGKQRESLGGGARRAHDQEQAVRMAVWGLRRLGMDREKLEGTPKGRLEKQVLAWWLHRQTTVTRRWLAQELGMRHESRVSQAVSAVDAGRARKVVEMKQKLQDYNG